MASESSAAMDAPTEWRDSVFSGLALCAVVAFAWLTVPAGHPMQVGVAVGAIAGGVLLPTATYLHLREVAAAAREQTAIPALAGQSRARLARLTGRVTLTRQTETTRTCPCKP